jgi:fibronectin type 3 domain-containing protein
LIQEEKKKIAEIPKISFAKGYMKHVDLKWSPIKDNNIRYVKIYRSENGKRFQTVGIQDAHIDRFADFTNETGKKYSYKISFLDKLFNESKLSEIASTETKNMSDEELMTMVQEASLIIIGTAQRPESGLSKENTNGRQNMIATGASGFGIMALIAGTERGFISRKESVERFTRIVNFIEKADKYHGAVAHFIDGKTGKTEPFFGKR